MCVDEKNDGAGNPKGVVLTHTNVLSTVLAMQAFCKESQIDYNDDDNVLSYLTMAHILGRVVEEFALSVGASIGYWQVCQPSTHKSSIFVIFPFPPFPPANFPCHSHIDALICLQVSF